MKKSITEKLTKTKSELDKIIKKSKARQKNAPPGSLNICSKHGKPRYYWNRVIDGKRMRSYLGNDASFRIGVLAQKDFDRKVIKTAEAQKSCIEFFLKHYEEDALKNIYAGLSPERKALIDADIPDDEEYARQWLEAEYEPGRFDYGGNEYYTLKGERVRSKSEKIIADTLYMKGIPYRYEYPLHLKNGDTWRPDFTILNKRTREVYILEHFGMMDDPVYAANAIGKMDIYIENGFFPGENLLITAESSAKPLSTKTLDMMISHYLV